MTVSLVILATMFLIGSHSVFGADGNAKPVDEEFLRGYMAGEYDLIGRKADSAATYTGHVTLRDEGGFYKSHEPSKAGPTNAPLDLIPWRAPIVFQFYESISILTAKSMTPPIAGNRILTITRDLQDTFIWPAPNRPDWKHFSQSTNDTNPLRNARSAFDFTRALSPLSHA